MPMIANVGSKWVDGKLVFFSKTTGNDILTLDPATDTLTINGFGPAVAQADSVAADVPALVVDFNALLAKLRTAGLLET